MFTFNELRESDGYKSLPEVNKIKAKIQYYKDFVEPQAIQDGVDIPVIKKTFFEATKEVPETTLSPITEKVTDFALGMAETPQAVLSPIVGGMASFLNPIPGLAGAKKYITEAYKTGDTDKALRESTKTIEGLQEAFQPYLVYQAQTPAGKLAQSTIAKVFDFFIHKPAQAGGELARRVTEPLGTDISAGAGAITETALELGGYGLLFRGMGQGLRNKILNKKPLTPKEKMQAEKSIIDIGKELKREAEINRENIPAYKRAGTQSKIDLIEKPENLTGKFDKFEPEPAQEQLRSQYEKGEDWRGKPPQGEEGEPPKPQTPIETSPKTLKEIRIMEGKEIPVYETTPPKPQGITSVESKLPEPQAGEGEYRGKHQIKEGQTTADNLLKIVPEDYLTNANVYSDLTDISTKESYRVLKNIQGKPDAIVTIYRAVPKGVDKINKGDWITLSKKYAIDHGKDMKDPSADMPVISMKVKTKDIAWDGNDINEFSYKGLPEKASPLKHKEAWEMTRIENWKQLNKTQREQPEARLREHKAAVKQAFSEGKPVPTEVLKDYPDLKPTVKEPLTVEQGRAGEVESIKVEKDILKLTPSQRSSLERGYREIEESTAGRRIVTPEEGSGTYKGTQLSYDYVNSVEPSTFPKWNKGMPKNVSLPLIRKALDEKPVTPAQKFRIENILDGIRSEELEQLKIIRGKPSEKPVMDSAIGDKFKRGGEEYKVTDINPDTGKTEFKNKDPFTLDQTDTIKYDRGTYKSAPIEEAPFGAEYENLPLESRVELLKRQGRPDLADKLRQEEMFKVERNFPQDRLQGKGEQKEGFEMTEEMKARENEARQGTIDIDIPKPISQFKEGSIVEIGGRDIEIIKHSPSGTTVRPVKKVSKQVKVYKKGVYEGDKIISARPKEYQISRASEVILKSEKGGVSLDTLVPELPTKEELKYLKPIARPVTDDKENKLAEQLGEGIKNFGKKYILDKWKEHNNKIILMSQGKLSPEEEETLISETMFLAGGLNSVLKPAMRLKFNPFQGLYKKIVKKFPEKIQEFLDPLSTLKNAENILEERAKLGGKITQIERIGKKIGEWFEKFSQEDKEKIFDYMRGELPASALSPEALKKANQSRSVLNLIGKMAVKEGFLDPETYAKNKDTYIHYLYAKHILGKDISQGISSGGKLNLGEFKQRKDLTEQYRKSIGLIKDPSKAISIGVTKTLTDVYKNKYLKFIADNPDWTWQPSKIKVAGKQYNPVDLADDVKTAKAVADYAKTPETLERYNALKSALDEAMEQTKNVPEGFKTLPDTPKMGALRGLAVKKPIYDDLKPIMGLEVKDMGNIAKALLNLERKSMAVFKAVKVGLNLPTATKNTGSNIIQLNMSGMNLGDIIYDTKNALGDILKKSPDYVKAERAGLFKTNWAVSEINELLEGIKDAKGFNIFGKLENMAKYYGKIDDLFKFAKYKYEIRQGTSHQKAVLEALKWGTDYSRASRSVKFLRQHAIPFLSYPYKIAPLIAESLVERPWVIGKYAAIPYMAMEYTKKLNNLTDTDQKRLEKELPYYIQKTGSYTVIPAEAKDGKYRWTNLRYFFPWGDFSEKAKMLNQGELGKVISEDISSPTVNVLALMKNWGLGKTPKDPFSGQEIYSRFDKPQDKVAKTMAWLYNLHAPGMLSLDNPLSAKDFFSDYGAMGYAQRYKSGEKDRYGRKITGGQAIGKFFGVNIIEPSKLQTRKIKDYQLRELIAGLTYALRKPNLSVEEKKRIREEFKEQRKAITSGEVKEYVPISKIKDNVKRWALK